MILKNIDGIEESVLNEQIKNYFFRIGYNAKTMCDEYRFYYCSKFIKENNKIMTPQRICIAEQSYNNGLSHEFPSV